MNGTADWQNSTQLYALLHDFCCIEVKQNHTLSVTDDKTFTVRVTDELTLTFFCKVFDQAGIFDISDLSSASIHSA